MNQQPLYKQQVVRYLQYKSFRQDRQWLFVTKGLNHNRFQQRQYMACGELIHQGSSSLRYMLYNL